MHFSWVWVGAAAAFVAIVASLSAYRQERKNIHLVVAFFAGITVVFSCLAAMHHR